MYQYLRKSPTYTVIRAPRLLGKLQSSFLKLTAVLLLQNKMRCFSALKSFIQINAYFQKNISIISCLFQTISSPLCIEYCRGSAQQHKYVLIDEDKCTCATDITFDIERNPANLADSPKWSSNKCSWSSTKTMIGNTANNVAALYNIEYSRQSETAKHASSTCRVFEHEMFYTSYGFQVLHLLLSFNALNLSHFENESTF